MANRPDARAATKGHIMTFHEPNTRIRRAAVAACAAATAATICSIGAATARTGPEDPPFRHTPAASSAAAHPGAWMQSTVAEEHRFDPTDGGAGPCFIVQPRWNAAIDGPPPVCRR